jgi:ABC-type transporter Mla subunit MlaD
MAENPGIGDLLGMFGTNNPLAGIGKTVDQFKRGINDFLAAVETFNKTMEQMAGVAERVNRLIDDVEPPIRAFMPQITRVIETTESVVSQLAEPIERVAPRISQLAENLSAPSFTDMSHQLGEFLDTLGDVGRGLKPLINMAESVGGMFGLRGLGRLAGGPSRLAENQPAASQPAVPQPAAASVATPDR